MMQFVPEKVIDEVAEGLGTSGVELEEALKALQLHQPALIPFLLEEENDSVFSESERGFMIYLLAVIWKSCLEVNGPQEPIHPDALSEAEEQNWELLEAVQAKRFRERLDVFFSGTPQEDLLAFLEDCLTEDEEDEEENPVSKEGREPIFVLLKSVVDCLDRAPLASSLS
ncbi:MAG: hypothetical protein IPI11_04850 [Haliscomenobacter sp.]|nr:hypothetical protein [Haliscomenobacter sp.]